MIQFIVAFWATVAFSVLFHVPTKEYLFCGLTGAIGWTVYLISCESGQSAVLASFFAVLVLTVVSRIFAVIRKHPITVFLIAGIFPLVPGSGIYYTAYYMITAQNQLALSKGLETVKIAGVIALGIVLVLALPNGLFNIFSEK